MIPLTNMVGFNSDNANVMVGKNNSVLSRLKSDLPCLMDLGCMSHLINLCVGGAVKSLPDGPWLHEPSDQPVRGGSCEVAA